MVSDDPYYVKKVEPVPPETEEPTLDDQIASPIDRAAAVVADFLVVSPVIAVVVAPFRRAAIEADLLGNSSALANAYYTAAFAALLAFLLFKTICHAAFGATPGQRFMRLEVVSVWTGEKPRPMEAFIRALVWCLDCVLVAPLAALYGNEKRRPLHDRAADTIVISTDLKRKRTGPPTLPEMSIAGGFQAAVLTALSISICVQILRPASTSDELLVRGLEAEGKLCKEVGEAHGEWAKGPSRLNVALTLFAAGALDSDCLRQEADFALWAEEEKSLGYLAKALTEEPEKKERYFDKACPEGKSDVCRTVSFLRALEIKNEFEDPTNPEQKASRVESENELASLIAALDGKSPAYLQIWAVKDLMQNSQYADAVAMMDQIAPQKKLGLFLARERAMALWQMGETEKSQAAFRASIPLLAPSGRVELARWFCSEETVGGTCSSVSTASACSALQDVVDRTPNLMMVSGVSAAYVRTELCKNGGKIDSDRAREISEQIPEKSGQRFIAALASLGRGEEKEALDELEKLATSRDDDDPFYLEANLKLVDLAENAADLKPLLARWNALKPESDSWRGLGLKITSRLGAFGHWNEALEIGMKLLRTQSLDRKLHEALVVSAYRAGQIETAKRFLQRLSAPGEATLREPASEKSETEFEKVARDLSSRKGGAS